MLILNNFLTFLCSLLACSNSSQKNATRFEYGFQQQEENMSTVQHPNWPVLDVCDSRSMKSLVLDEKTVYRIVADIIIDTIRFPSNCELYFKGGSIKGVLYFKNTLLSGNPRLQGSSLNGKIKNSTFEAGWICYGDGVHDDANNINQILKVCDKIYFQDGLYLLRSMHTPNERLPVSFHSSVNSHIGIYRSNVYFEGDNNACLLVEDGMSAINIYSNPNESPIKNIQISKMKFKCINDGILFREFNHTIKVIGVDTLVIKDCHFYDFFGDAICLSHYGDNPSTGERTRNRNVLIKDNYIDGSSHNNRNAISVISGQKVSIHNNYIEHTSKSDMPGAIDVEANNSAFTIDDIKITNNYIKDSKGGGGAISIVSERDAPAHNVIISSNVIENTKCGIFIKIDSRNTTTGINIQNNQLFGVEIPIYVKGTGTSRKWTVKDNSFRFTRKNLGGVSVDKLQY